MKVLVKLFLKACGFQRQSLGRRPQTAKFLALEAHLQGVNSKISPVDCFGRGDALQVKASPYRPEIKVFLQSVNDYYLCRTSAAQTESFHGIQIF